MDSGVLKSSGHAPRSAHGSGGNELELRALSVLIKDLISIFFFFFKSSGKIFIPDPNTRSPQKRVSAFFSSKFSP